MHHQEMIDIIQSHLDGKAIQSRPVSYIGMGTFADEKQGVVFDFIGFDYRVKPDPKYTVLDDVAFDGIYVEIKALEDALKIISTMDAEPNLNSNEIPETKALKALIN